MAGWGHSIAAWARKAVGPDSSTVPDGELCARFAATRDPAAFELLVWRHAAMVQRTALAVTRDHHLAEDVSQAAFLVLAKQAGTLREPNAVAGFLHTTAHRMALRAIRLRRGVPLTDTLPAKPVPADDGSAALLHEEVARLPAAWRAAVLLCFFEGLTHAEAAERLGKPVGSVAGWIARAKDTLHDRLTRRGVTLPAAGLTALTAVGRTDARHVEAVTAASLAYVAGTPPASPLVLTLLTGATHAMFFAKLKVATVATAVALSGVGVTAGGYALVQAQGPGVPGGPPLKPNPKTVTRIDPPRPAEPVAEQPKPAADYKQIVQSRKNLSTLKTAVQGYSDTFGHLPIDLIVDGKPLLSWRVAILPWLEAENLYRQFKLNEPWDSEHNLKLLSKMPEALNVGFEAAGATHTHYQVVAAPGAALFPRRDGGGGMGMPGGALACRPAVRQEESEVAPARRAVLRVKN